MDADFLRRMKENYRVSARQRYGLADKSPEQLHHILALLLEILPREQMREHAKTLEGSDRVTDKVAARQIRILLFSSEEMDACLENLSDSDRRQFMLEFLAKEGK